MAKDKDFPYEVIVTGKYTKEDSEEQILFGPETFMAKNEQSARYAGLLKMADKVGIKKAMKELDIFSLSVKARQF